MAVKLFMDSPVGQDIKAGTNSLTCSFYGGTRPKQTNYPHFIALESFEIQCIRFESKKLGWLGKIL
jgi:hypothetical protein